MPAVTLTDSDFVEYDASNPLPVTATGTGTGGSVEVEVINTNPNGQATMANSSPVAIASDQSVIPVAGAPSTSSSVAITPTSGAAVASSLVLKNSGGNFYGCNATTGAVAGYVMLFNATSAPGDGAVTPVKVWPLAALAALTVEYQVPLRLGTGITLVFSSTGPYTKTASATAFLSGDAV